MHTSIQLGAAGVATEWLPYPARPESTVVGTVLASAALFGPPGSQARQLLVYLPPSYASSARRYPVLYMHDGQNLFDAATSFSGEWQVDETMEALSAEGIEAIVVGIPNAADQRTSEYTPQAFGVLGGGGAATYVRFIVETVKPLIDRDFRTLPDRAHTGTMGSSLGGLVSLYAFFAAPEVFGFVGALSPSLWWARGAVFGHIERARYRPGRIYLDVGDMESARMRGRPTGYVDSAQRMASLLRAKGYTDADLAFHVEAGGRHDEASWARRLAPALRFLLGPLGP